MCFGSNFNISVLVFLTSKWVLPQMDTWNKSCGFGKHSFQLVLLLDRYNLLKWICSHNIFFLPLSMISVPYFSAGQWKQSVFNIFTVMWSNFSVYRLTLMPEDFRFLSSTLPALCSSAWSSSAHGNIRFSFWCIACCVAHGTVGPCKCNASWAALISSGAQALNSWLSGFSQRDRKWGQRERIVRHWFAVKNLDRRSFQRRLGRSKAPLAESEREGRWYRRALISFTDECEMASSVVWTHTRRHYRLLYPDLPFLYHFLLHANSYRLEKNTAAMS